MTPQPLTPGLVLPSGDRLVSFPGYLSGHVLVVPTVPLSVKSDGDLLVLGANPGAGARRAALAFRVAGRLRGIRDATSMPAWDLPVSNGQPVQLPPGAWVIAMPGEVGVWEGEVRDIVLLVGFYTDANDKRNQELRECLRRNLANPAIPQVRAFLEDEAARPEWAEFASNPKAMLVEHGRRCTYQDFFRHANENLSGRVVVISNADIWFDETVRMSKFVDSRTLAAISRYDYWRETKSTPSNTGQDAWIFRSPIMDFECNWELGRASCDHRIAAEARIAGLIVKNPSLDIKAYHLHATMLRRTLPWLPGEKYIPPWTKI